MQRSVAITFHRIQDVRSPRYNIHSWWCCWTLGRQGRQET